MPSITKAIAVPERDGTSQVGRALAALQPSYVSIDERTIAELVEFARGYGKALIYHGLDGEQGDWSGFIGAVRGEDVVAFLRDPGAFDPKTSPELFRPHFVLFLVFLQLLERARAELNTLTARHLDFYYRQYLRLQRRPAVPDQVEVIVALTAGVKQALLPGGTRLKAGPDARGQERIYVTDGDRVVNQAQLARALSLFVDQRRTRLLQVPARYDNDPPRVREALFKLALGDPLPSYPDGAAVDSATLTKLRARVQDARGLYFLSIAELRELMERKRQRPAPPAEWDGINAKLEIAGKKNNGATFSLDHSSRDFAGNLAKAVGWTPDYSTLPQVKDIDDLYDLRARADVAAFIRGRLYFDDVEGDFGQMMRLKRQFDSAWGEINRRLELAGQRKRQNKDYRLTPADVTDFARNAMDAIGRSDLEAYFGEVQALERYFFLPAERFASAMDAIGAQDWQQASALLEDAHQAKLRAERLDALRRTAGATAEERLLALLNLVLGEGLEAPNLSAAMDRVEPFLTPQDLASLQTLTATDPTLRAWDWEKIYGLLEVAQHNRMGEPPAETVEWLNLYPAEDAAAVRSPQALQDGAARFVPFGLARPSADPDAAPPPVLGFALSSPLLVLSEGARTITLTLGFRAAATALAGLFKGEMPLRVELSTAKGWIECAAVTVNLGSYQALAQTSAAADAQLEGLQLVLSIEPGVDAIAALPGGLGGIASPWPSLRLMLRPLWREDLKQHVARYAELAHRVLLAAHLRVAVSDLKALVLQNDETTLNSKKPFEPFTGTPSVGSRFWIGQREVVTKRLDSLDFTPTWMGVPDGLTTTHYKAYGLGDKVNFTAKISLVDRAGEVVLAEAAPLFEPLIRVAAIPADARRVDPASSAASWLDDELSGWRRSLVWELNSPDLQHGRYLSVAASKSLALAAAIVNGVKPLVPADYEVNPPYTPKLKSLTLGYSSSLELRFESKNAHPGSDLALHIHPFGACDIEAERSRQGVPFLPRYDNDGELYLGLSGVSAPQTVALGFQVAEGSADPDLAQQPIAWSYLSGDRWLPLARQVLSDSTRGLIKTGIIELSLPVAEASTRLPGGLYYLRATVARDTTSVCEISGAHTQMVSATFVDNHNAPEHYQRPLPAGTITRLWSAQPEIAGVRQPYPSHGGRMAEGDALWTTRVSERLRHKRRAVSVWDYERLILDQFPEVYKAKCIPAGPSAPGKVQVIIIPDIRDKRPFDPFAPKAPSSLLLAVREYLSARAPASAQIEVRNAHYVAVQISLGVRFRGAGNEAFYVDKLNAELSCFLSPWAYDQGADIAISGRIYANSIIDFVERRPYVDYAAGITLFSSDDGVHFVKAPRPLAGSSEGYSVGALRPDAVLSAARAHKITVLTEDLYEEKLLTGINYMKVELDFIVAEG